MAGIRRDEASRLYVFHSEQLQLSNPCPQLGACQLHWYVGSAHSGSHQFALEDGQRAKVPFCSFLVVKAGLDEDVKFTIATADGNHMGLHAGRLQEMANSEQFTKQTMMLRNVDGVFAEAVVHVAAQIRWTKGPPKELGGPISFVDPAEDAQSSFILEHLFPDMAKQISEQKKKLEAVEKAAAEKATADKAAAEKKAEEERLAAEKKAEEERLAAEKAAAEKAAAEKAERAAAEEKRVAEKAAEERRAAEQAAAEKAAEERRAAEEAAAQRAANEKAAAQREAAEKLAEEKAAAEEKVAAEAAAKRAAAQKAVDEERAAARRAAEEQERRAADEERAAARRAAEEERAAARRAEREAAQREADEEREAARNKAAAEKTRRMNKAAAVEQMKRSALEKYASLKAASKRKDGYPDDEARLSGNDEDDQQGWGDSDEEDEEEEGAEASPGRHGISKTNIGRTASSSKEMNKETQSRRYRDGDRELDKAKARERGAAHQREDPKRSRRHKRSSSSLSPCRTPSPASSQDLDFGDSDVQPLRQQKPSKVENKASVKRELFVNGRPSPEKSPSPSSPRLTRAEQLLNSQRDGSRDPSERRTISPSPFERVGLSDIEAQRLERGVPEREGVKSVSVQVEGWRLRQQAPARGDGGGSGPVPPLDTPFTLGRKISSQSFAGQSKQSGGYSTRSINHGVPPEQCMTTIFHVPSSQDRPVLNVPSPQDRPSARYMQPVLALGKSSGPPLLVPQLNPDSARRERSAHEEISSMRPLSARGSPEVSHMPVSYEAPWRRNGCNMSQSSTAASSPRVSQPTPRPNAPQVLPHYEKEQVLLSTLGGESYRPSDRHHEHEQDRRFSESTMPSRRWDFELRGEPFDSMPAPVRALRGTTQVTHGVRKTLIEYETESNDRWSEECEEPHSGVDYSVASAALAAVEWRQKDGSISSLGGGCLSAPASARRPRSAPGSARGEPLSSARRSQHQYGQYTPRGPPSRIGPRAAASKALASLGVALSCLGFLADSGSRGYSTSSRQKCNAEFNSVGIPWR